MRELIDYTKYCACEFGNYVQGSLEEEIKNDNLTRSVDTIYLRPCQNMQGGHELIDFSSGRVITRSKVALCKVTDMVIKVVEEKARSKGLKV